MPRPVLNPPFSRPAGFTLVEVLVALLVLAIGLLGLAALFAETLRVDREAAWRSQALTLAADMAERIRANPAAGAAYEEPGTDLGCGDGRGELACSPGQLAAQDVFDWRRATGAALPSGEIGLTFTPAAGETAGRYTLNLSWSGAGSAGRQGLVMAVEP